jgi:murein DD-endopeptidase MepM/ murein hydrolase activator NlpD
MQILITHGTMARTRAVRLNRIQLLGAVFVLGSLLMLVSGAIYHFIFLKAAREGWPVVSPIVGLVVRDDVAQRERFMRENLDAMARKLGQMQAKLVKLEAMGERVSGLAGVKPEEVRTVQRGAAGGQGGLYVPVGPLERPTLEQLSAAVAAADELADQRTDVFTLIESRLFENRMQKLMIPSSAPVAGPVGSGFGFRSDPFSGRTALHTGLDFAADTGTPINAAAGGVVRSAEHHPQYGQMIEIDHGNGLVTRYAHGSKLVVKAGDLVKRGQTVALVGSTGRSTGPHLHFEVLVDGVPQDPSRFLSGRGDATMARLAGRRR